MFRTPLSFQYSLSKSDHGSSEPKNTRSPPMPCFSISVSSQRDTERALIAKETRELAEEPEEELAELADLYRQRGLSDELA